MIEAHKGRKRFLEITLIDKLVRELHILLEKKDRVVFGICGGRSVGEIFDLLDLCSLFRKDIRIPWEKIHIFMVDERLVSITDPESNFALAKEHFVDDLVARKLLPKKNVHPFRYDKKSKDAGTSAYTKELKKVGGTFDIILLSIGEDGHCAGLYPNHTVKNKARGFFAFHDSPKPPADRMTASRTLLLKSQVGFLVAFGRGKKAAFRKFQSAATINQCPAKLVKKLPRAYVFHTH